MKDYEKLEVLKHTLANIKEAADKGGRVGFCMHLPLRVNMSDLPELEACRPKVNGDSIYWFERRDAAPRIEILEKLIKELEAKIPWYTKLFEQLNII
jgi:hypothetical protein